MNKASKYLATLLVLTILAVGINLAPSLYATNQGESTGTVTIGASLAEIVSDQIFFTNGSVANCSLLSVGTEYWINVTVHSPSSMANVTGIEFELWDAPAGGTQGFGVESNAYVFEYAYDGENVTWTSNPVGAYLNSTNHIASQDDDVYTFTFRCAFLLSKVAHQELTSTALSTWKVSITVNTSVGACTPLADLGFGLEYYSEVTATTSAHDFGVLYPGDTEQPIETPGGGYIDVTWIANNDTSLQVSADGDLQGKGAAAGHSIAVVNVIAKGDNNSTDAVALISTPTYQLLPGATDLTPPTEVVNPEVNPVYLWITVPAVCFPGVYQYTLYVQAVKAA